MNSIPIISQVRSLILYAKGNKKEAISCANEFSSKAIGVSQLKSLYRLVVKKEHLSAFLIQQQFMQKSNLFIQISMLICFVLVPFAELAVIHAVGFGVNGIVKKSIAATWMASFHGDIPKSSLFSSLQTIGRSESLPFFAQVIPQIVVSCLIGVAVALVLCFHESQESSDYSPIVDDEAANLLVEEERLSFDEGVDRCLSTVSVD